VFKAQGPQTWAKIFDFGNIQTNGPRGDFLFGQYAGNADQMTFQMCDQEGDCGGLDPIGSFFGPVQGVWNHAVLVVQEGTGGGGNWFVYINGSLVTSLANNFYPLPLSRNSQCIGRSTWLDNYWQGEVDSFTMYNYAATAMQAQNLWFVNQGLPTVGGGGGGGGSGLSDGAIAGIVIGSVVGAVLLLALLLFLCWCGRRDKQTNSSRFQDREQSQTSKQSVEMGDTRTGV